MTNLLKGDNIRAILDHPLLFNGARDILAGSQATTHELVGRYIGEDRPTLVLDIGCGTGDFSVHSTSYYVGLDKNRHFVRYAQRRYAGSGKEFIIADALHCPFASHSFNTTLLINCLHHFSDTVVLSVLREVARLAQDRVLIVDLVSDTENLIRKFFNALDRGDYVRSIARERSLIERVLDVSDVSLYNSRLAPQAFFLCFPR